MKYRILIIPIMMLTVFSSCTSSSRLTLLWEDDEYERGQIEKVLVVAVVKDSLTRRAAEYHIKRRLKDNNVNAVTSLEVMPARAKQTKEAFKQLFYEYEFDGVLTVRAAGEETKISSGYNRNYTPNYSYSGFYGYYNMIYDQTFSSQYTVRDKVVRIEANLYDTLDEKLIWSGLAETKNPDKLSDVIKPLSRMLSEELIERNFFKED